MPPFDAEDYKSLCERYLKTQTIRKMCELQSGMKIRRQYHMSYIECLPDYVNIQQKINSLLKLENHTEVYFILRQIRNWEISPQEHKVFYDPNIWADEVQECGTVSRDDVKKDAVDLTKEAAGASEERICNGANESAMMLYELKCSVLGLNIKQEVVD